MTTTPFASTVRFPKGASGDFYHTLRSRATAYFEDNRISRHANAQMVVKTVFMACLYLVPFILSLTVADSKIFFFSLWLLMGVGISGIGLSVMHDANHGAYSSHKAVNRLLGYLLNVVGGCAAYWKIQHNVLHHTYTNIQGVDDDISRVKILRFSPHAGRMKLHRYQHYYAWLLYGLMTLSWVTTKEFAQLFEFRDRGLLPGKHGFRNLLLEVVITKALYYAYILVLPILILPFSPWFILLCFLCMHFVAGQILSLVFQPAHVLLENEFPLPNTEGRMENNWAVHQLLTTSDFGQDNRLLSWFVGGLNFQIEHHLFPKVCHVHYRALSGIVRQTAAEFHLPYHTEKSWGAAIRSHWRMLRELAKP
ncbi:MAG: acyl-CoA desaturase [Lewinellaceae bacterium]|nr:acyl-CoA desaturase [Lewinellaceae bacterium]